MLTLAPTFACRRAPSRLIRDCHYTAVRQFMSSSPQTSTPSGDASGPSSLAGTAPDHTAYILLHTRVPPAEYPPRSKSALWRAFTMKARQWGGVVNFAWSPALRVHGAYAGLGEDPQDKRDPRRETYAASVFSIAHRYGRLEIPEISLANLDEIDDALRTLVLGPTPGGASGGEAAAQAEAQAKATAQMAGELDRRLHLFVCTHGSRDCRCGEGGGEVARALARELEKRGIGAKDVVLGEVAHVGGHKYAANLLVYPYGDWLGTVQDFDVPQVLDDVLAWHATSQERLTRAGSDPHSQDLPPPLCPPFWRGRMGLDKDEQLALYSKAA
ncbi:Sucrase/ferredoxin-like-domain-containing protein [Trametes elegans]|nr:Sucrase/ferredoxin-like-domain-containing protein [Trametes elegans]